MRLVARFAIERGESFEVLDVYDSEVNKTTVPRYNPHIQTLSSDHPAALWFERKMNDDFGITIDGAIDRRPLVQQEHFPHGLHPMRQGLADTPLTRSSFVPYRYETIDGDGVFQVSVGPIHAGIIEPGHFHFSQAGEEILHLEIRHFYKHRAIEKMLEGKTLYEAKPIIERISGNASIAYQIAWSDIVRQAARIKFDDSTGYRYAFLLELERIIHHLTDLGFIPNDAGFGPALAFCSTLAEDARRMMRKLTGHRFGFGAVGFKHEAWDIDQIIIFLDKLEKEMEFFESWITDIPSLWDIFDTTGILHHEDAVNYGTTGVIARASGVDNDRRMGDELYIRHGFEPIVLHGGDVSARFRVRLQELKSSILLMRRFLSDKPEQVYIPDIQDGSYMSFVESATGELFMYIEIQDGAIVRFFSRDPGFVNWQAMHLMMPGNIIADFPLINKSCDLSYAGNDL